MTLNEIKQLNNIDKMTEASKKIHRSCSPLEKLGIIEFRYARSFNDLTQFSISPNFQFVEEYYALDFHKIGSFNKHPSRYKNSTMLWSDVDDSRPFLYARDRFSIGKGITLVEKRHDGCEFYFIGGSVDNKNITTFLMNHISLLRRFISYFKSENKKIIAEARHCGLPLYLPEDPKEIAINTNEDCLLAESQKKIDEFLHATQPKQLYFNNNGHEVVLTKAESRCLALLLQGKSAEQTAQLLFNSRRTIEQHLDRTRAKLGCENKLQLVALIAKHCEIL